MNHKHHKHFIVHTSDRLFERYHLDLSSRQLETLAIVLATKIQMKIDAHRIDRLSADGEEWVVYHDRIQFHVMYSRYNKCLTTALPPLKENSKGLS